MFVSYLNNIRDVDIGQTHGFIEVLAIAGESAANASAGAGSPQFVSPVATIGNQYTGKSHVQVR